MEKKICELLNSDTSKEFFEIIEENNLNDYKKAGVWALFGQKKTVESDENKKWFCLQVAETKNIANEIRIDIECIEGEMVCRDKSYVNQFNETIFSYKEYPSIKEILYNHIKNNFENLKFICVKLEENREIRKKVEKMFANKTKAIYWRNGRPYMNGNPLDLNNINLTVQFKFE